MSLENDFLPFACGSSANVEAQTTWASDAVVTNGFQSGTANSQQVNKVLRQASIMASVIADFIVANATQPAIDDGTTATLLTNLQAGVNALIAAGVVPYAPLASPALTGTPSAPTAASSTNTTQVATTAFVKAQGYAPLAGPALTGVATSTTPSTSDNSTAIATTSYVKSNLVPYAPLASPAFTGTPTASGNVNVAAQLNANSASLGSLTVTGNAIVDGSLQVMGAASLNDGAISSAALAGSDNSYNIANTNWVQSNFPNLSTAFLNSLGSNGWQNLPGGLILQWGTVSATTGNGDSFNYNKTFPNNVICAVGGDDGAGANSCSVGLNGAVSFKVYCKTCSTGAYAATTMHWIAIGN